MGSGVNVDEVPGKEISPGVVERIMFRPEQTGRGPPGKLSVKHYTLTEGAQLTIRQPDAERLDYIISGAVLFPRGGNIRHHSTRSRYYFSNTAIMVPYGKETTYYHEGEAEAHIVSHAYTVPDPSKRYLYPYVQELADYWGESQGVPIALRLGTMHRIGGVSFQIRDILQHVNNAETCYFLRGRGRMRSGDEVFRVRPGTLVYTEDYELHEIKKDEDSLPLNYIVIEYHPDDGRFAEYIEEPSLLT